MKRASGLAFARGFTLMELLIVIVLLGFLIAMATGSFVSSQIKARDARRKSDLHQISLVLEAYFNDYQRYPSAAADGKIKGCGDGGTNDCTWGGQFSDSVSGVVRTIYMVTLPGDPSSGQRYVYAGGGTSYRLYALLENTDDRDVYTGGYSVFCDQAGTTKKCNYGIASTNTTP